MKTAYEELIEDLIKGDVYKMGYKEKEKDIERIAKEAPVAEMNILSLENVIGASIYGVSGTTNRVHEIFIKNENGKQYRIYADTGIDNGNLMIRKIFTETDVRIIKEEVEERLKNKKDERGKKKSEKKEEKS